MRTNLLALGTVALLALGLVGSGCKKDMSNAVSPAPVNNVPAATTVLMSGGAFSPVTITIKAGQTVTWQNNDAAAHTSTGDAGEWDTGRMASGSTMTTTFAKAGTFPYHCTYHVTMGMRGTVIVQ